MTPDLRSQQETFADCWRQGVSGQEILHRYSDLVDDFIINRFAGAQAATAVRGEVAVIALGGYGRRELYPYSDIDLLLLHDRWSKKSMQSVTESTLYPLWDAGLEVGHSVRGIGESAGKNLATTPFCLSLISRRAKAG